MAIEKGDGNRHFHLTPAAALDFRAAEYGIDPEDTDALMEIILHENHIPTVDREDAPSARYLDDGPDLLTAENTTVARETHLRRIKTCPMSIRVRGAKGLDVIRAGHRPDLARIRATREAVDTTRWIRRYGDLPIKPPTLEDHRA
ncbi:hypothetical protein [Streptomyces sp. NPDC059489]|uniref:hypothetical protein n=1 Tax=Streptomyces sp. NPDC059489 TaxID=3346849 RepID=UPI0036CB8ECD